MPVLLNNVPHITEENVTIIKAEVLVCILTVKRGVKTISVTVPAVSTITNQFNANNQMIAGTKSWS